jgi:hypothetical protein
LSFAEARANFYAAAQDGLNAAVCWAGRRGPVSELCLERLLPLAAAGLRRLGISGQESARWLDILRGRLATGRTGAAWQRAWVARHGQDFEELVCRYHEAQQTDRPVHEWEV